MADADSDVRNPVATQRFLELVESMGEAREHRRGWKREVAELLAADEKERPRLALELARLVVFSLNAKEK